MYLDPTQSLQIVLGGAKTSLDALGQLSYELVPVNTGTPGAPVAMPIGYTVPFTTNGATAVPLVPAPPANMIARVVSIQLNNADTGSITPSFQIITTVAAVATTRTVLKFTRATLEQFNYTLAGGSQGYSVALAKQ